MLSQRIVNFREKLGGFIKLEQIQEVYGLKPEVAAQMMEFCHLGARQVRQIKINEASIQVLKNHPYINYTLAKAIVNYRKEHGNYRALEDLLKIKIINSEILDKIAPYLSV